VLTIFASAINVVTILNELNMTYSTLARDLVGIPMFILAILSIFIPIMNFSFTKSRRSVDEFYSLPISKVNLMFVKGGASVVDVVIPYTISFFFGFLIVLLSSSGLYMGYYLLFFAISLLIGLSITFYIIFLYIQGNTILDGLIIIGMGVLVFVAVTGAILQPLNSELSPFIFTPFYSYVHLTNLFSSLIYDASFNINSNYYDVLKEIIEPIIGHSFTFLLGGVSVLLLYFQTKKNKAELAEDLSTSWFGYKTMIPIFMIGLLTMVHDSGEIILYVIIVILAIVMTMIEYRSVKLTWKTWGRLGIYLLASIVLSFLLSFFVTL